jgi:hypothetical protein
MWQMILLKEVLTRSSGKNKIYQLVQKLLGGGGGGPRPHAQKQKPTKLVADQLFYNPN